MKNIKISFTKDAEEETAKNGEGLSNAYLQ